MSSTNKNHSRNSMSRHHMNNANNRNRNISNSSSSSSSRSINSMRSTGRLALLGILFVLFVTNSSLFHNTNTNNNNNKQEENNLDFISSSSSNRKLHHGHHHKHSQPPPIIDYSLYSCDEINELQSKLNLPSMDRCQFAKNCNDGDGVMFPSLFCDGSSSSTSSTSSSTGTGTSKTASKTTKTTQQTTTASGSSNITPSSSSSSSSNNTTSLSAAAAAFTTTQDILSKTQNILLLIILSLTLLLLFHLLNSTTDEFFSPGLELFSLHFGLPPRFAGVTLLALGNGAPDVAATINAILEDPAKGYQMALGELTGTAMFVSGVILGVIVYMSGEEEEKEEESVGDGIDGNSNVCNDDGTTNNDNEGIAKDAAIVNKSNSSGGGKKKRKGVPCGSALLRDIAVLILVLLVSMSYFERGVVDYGLVYSLLGIYVAYVLLVLGADSYHIFYHLPKLLKGEREGNNEGEGVENGCLECGDLKGRDRYLEEDGAKADGTSGDYVKEFANECTPLVVSSYRSDNLQSQKQCSRHHHIYHRHQSLPVHSHTLGDSVIEAMSNYNCDEEQEIDNHQQHHHHHIMSSRRSTICGIISTIDSNGETISTNTTNKNTNILTSSSSVSGSSLTTKRIGWAPRSDDGSEPLVIFHPHHAVHPHHEGGPSFIRRQSSDSGAVGNSAEHKGILFARSWSHGDATRSDDEDVGNGILPSGSQLKQSSSCDATATPAVQSSKESNYSVQSMIITNAYTTNDENNNQVAAISIDGDDTNNNNTPSSWKEAWKNNWQEWIDHWNDFFSDIYQNKENSLLDVILLSVELPFTIARKLTNPVPCDGYYCRPLVAVSTALSPIWLTFYFWEQFEVNIFSSNVGYIVTFTTSTIALCVARFAPDGDGPMEFYMVVPLTLYGFAIAATWLDSIADKLVQLLELFGILLRIPKTVMGLTVLAFGNSIQDLVANISISKKGLSTMAVTACLAGPIFNFGVGLGLGFLALLKTTGRDEIIVTFPSELKTGFYFTIANCFLIVIAGTVVGKGMIGREFGYIACALYVAYVITAIYV